MFEQRLILINLLVMLGVAAAVSSALVRSIEFKHLLFREERSLRQKIYLALWMCVPMALGVWIRFSARSFIAADLSFETTMLLGVIGGRVAGMMGGGFLALPALLYGEWVTLPFNVLAGLAAGQLRTLAEDKEEVWSFSPFVDLTILRWIRRNLPWPRLFDWQIIFFLTILGFRFVRTEIAHFLPHGIFDLRGEKLWVNVLIYATAVIVIGTELKIWSSVRIQIKLEEQERLLLQARMEALQHQINPHFLFNTLNSVSSLVRFDPDTARDLIIKLANILRRLLHSMDAMVALREEVEFIDDYLDIEVVRFGRDKLKVVKTLDLSSLDAMVPSMLLQPFVENCIKHGLSPKIEGGTITLRSRLQAARLTIEIEDDGVGMGAGQSMARRASSGIGMSNVAERLQVLYGNAARITIDSREGRGTLVRLELPILQEAPVASQIYEERSSTRR
jgi:two-component system, LytTR family, sensor kinase